MVLFFTIKEYVLVVGVASLKARRKELTNGKIKRGKLTIHPIN
jgi:hypothetical protein